MAGEQQSLLGDLQGSVVLAEEQIRTLVSKGKLIRQETFDGACLQSTSYDVRIGKKAVLGGQGNELDLTKESLTIGPGSYAGIISLEVLNLPNDVLARIGSKRKFSYDGLILLTGSVVDPGYEGHLLFGIYNASSEKRVLRMSRKICTVIFEKLDSNQTPVGSDPDLLVGDFPGDFLNSMANMDVLPWAKISDEVKRIQQLASDVLDLKRQYSDVLEPIQRLTENVAENARQISNVSTNVQLLTTKMGEQDEKLTALGISFGKFSAVVNIFWAIVLLAIGALIAMGITGMFSGDSPAPQ